MTPEDSIRPGRPLPQPAARTPDEAGSAPAARPGLMTPSGLYDDDSIASLRSRASAYLAAGVPVHFRGRAGMGKTTLALRLAEEIGRPVSVLTGDAGLEGADLVGRPVGQDTTRLRDRYVHSVTRSEERTRTVWRDSVLTSAVAEGHTLVYDEFTRSTAETNNTLLSVLEEGVLIIPSALRSERYVRAHPEFRAIFTSNPDEYAGVQAAPDALFDRMITFDVSWCDPETEAGIVACRTGVGRGDARRVVTMLRRLRDSSPGENPPSLRTAVMIGRVMRRLGLEADARDGLFVQVCLDVLETRAPARVGDAERGRYLDRLRTEIVRACPAPDRPRQRPETA